MSAEKLRNEALALPLDERAALARDLLLSLDEPADSGAEEAWAEDANRRLSRDVAPVARRARSFAAHPTLSTATLSLRNRAGAVRGARPGARPCAALTATTPAEASFSLKLRLRGFSLAFR
jgi:hypothetical protein